VNSNIRPAAVAGSWYPRAATAIAGAVDGYLARVECRDPVGDVVALVAPHAGLMYSGPVAAHAYRLLRDRTFEVIVLVGPSHFVGFDGVAIWPRGGFETALGIATVHEGVADDLIRACPVVRPNRAPHMREHSLEMQLPFTQHLAPAVPIVPLLVGYQTMETARALGQALATTLRSRRALMVASTDLSHYHDAPTAHRLDRTIIERLGAFDVDGLQRALEDRPEHACGGGPTVAVMRAASALGATDARILHYADSGDVSGDKSAVVGYVSAALGRFDDGNDV
jgi:AmmeMemoRadiSam system protein B